MNTTRIETISKISNIIKDYDNLPPTVDSYYIESVNNHVERWVSQFEKNDVDFILNHTYRLLSSNYYSKDKYDLLLNNLARTRGNEKLFKRNCFICVQSHGSSQSYLTNKLSSIVYDEIAFDFPIFRYSENKYDISDFKYFTYLDDFSFSGKIIEDDIKFFIESMNLNNVEINIFVFICHSQGFYNLQNRLKKFVSEKNLNIRFCFNKRLWGEVNNSTGTEYSWESGTYFPTRDTCDHILNLKGLTQTSLYKPNVFRVDSHKDCILGSFDDRCRIEKIFSSFGFDILSNSINLKKSMKPLGFSTYNGFGFGGNIFSYRNCSNNTPLVFWWGSYEKVENNAIDCWYPLMKRKGYYN